MTGDVRNEFLIPVLFDVEDQGELSTLFLAAEPFASKKEAQFERHIESGQVVYRVQTHFGDVMNSEPTLLNDALDLREEDFARVIGFTSAPGNKSEFEYGENNRAENG